ncbi:Hypothetical predicted protein [Marmota monax]|uniref:Uncharacterized protein n=1 Tax=Marmota monax TaxID=9995 RepID=A0A5E4ACB5_MARMO|nr:hypothetical protein GHT09_003851 [Marmota monax]VTJ54848.1 Hypothetical predicted protein [Marmota monax]
MLRLPRSEQSLNHHVCSLDHSSLSRWVRVPHRPASPRAKWGGGRSQSSRFPLFVGICLTLLPEPAGSEGPGRRARTWRSEEPRVNRESSDRPPCTLAPGEEAEDAKVRAASWLASIHPDLGFALAYLFSRARGSLGVREESLSPCPPIPPSSRPERQQERSKQGYLLIPTEGHTSSGGSAAFGVQRNLQVFVAERRGGSCRYPTLIYLLPVFQV